MLDIPDGGAYQIVVVAHVVAVVAGFGGLILARRVGPGVADGLLGRLEWLVYAVPVLGVVAVMLSADRWHFSEPWIGGSLAAYLGAVGIHQGVLRPARRGGSATSTGHATSAASEPGRAAQVGGVAFDVLVVLAVALMVVKPGA